MATSLKIESTDGARNTYNTNVNYINESCADGTLRTFADKLFELSNNTVHSVAKITTTDITNAQPEPSQGVVVTENQVKITHPNFSDDTVLKDQLFAHLSYLISDEVTDITGVTDTSDGCEATVSTTNTEDPIQTAYVSQFDIDPVLYVAVADVPSGIEITRSALSTYSSTVYGWKPISITQMIHSYLSNTLTWANVLNLSFSAQSASEDYEKVAGQHFANCTFTGNTVTFTFDWSKIKTESFEGTGSVYCGALPANYDESSPPPFLNFNGFLDSYAMDEGTAANAIMIETNKYFNT